MRVRSVLKVVAAAVVVFSAAACSDSSGPGSGDASAALQSLALLDDIATSTGATFSPRQLLALGGLLDQLDVNIAGKTETMYAFGFRQTFPAGSCLETIFINPSFPPTPGECTTPDLGMMLILWQSHSASAPPDRMILISSGVGDGDFSFESSLTGTQLPAFAFYLEGPEKLWASVSGTITSHIIATNQSCSLALPPYASSATCSIANFDEQADFTVEDFTFLTNAGPSIKIVIPRHTVHGVWQAITQAKPVTIPR